MEHLGLHLSQLDPVTEPLPLAAKTPTSDNIVRKNHERDSINQEYRTGKKSRIEDLKEKKDEEEEATRPITLKTPRAYSPQETSEHVQFISVPWA